MATASPEQIRSALEQAGVRPDAAAALAESAARRPLSRRDWLYPVLAVALLGLLGWIALSIHEMNARLGAAGRSFARALPRAPSALCEGGSRRVGGPPAALPVPGEETVTGRGCGRRAGCRPTASAKTIPVARRRPGSASPMRPVPASAACPARTRSGPHRSNVPKA